MLPKVRLRAWPLAWTAGYLRTSLAGFPSMLWALALSGLCLACLERAPRLLLLSMVSKSLGTEFSLLLLSWGGFSFGRWER